MARKKRSRPPESMRAYSRLKDALDDPESRLASILELSKLFQPTIPKPGSVFRIRSEKEGDIVALQRGDVILTANQRHPGGYWIRDDANEAGWFGIRNHISGKFLGFTKGGRIICEAKDFKGSEGFRIHRGARGDLVLVMQDGYRKPVGRGASSEIHEDTEPILVLLEGWDETEATWEFLHVDVPGPRATDHGLVDGPAVPWYSS